MTPQDQIKFLNSKNDPLSNNEFSQKLKGYKCATFGLDKDTLAFRFTQSEKSRSEKNLKVYPGKYHTPESWVVPLNIFSKSSKRKPLLSDPEAAKRPSSHSYNP